MIGGKNKKGILLTLVTLVLFILMLGELITYVIININYNQLSSTGAAALGSSTFLNFISGSAPSFLSTSLSSAVGALTVYEGTPSMRQYRFINNTALALSGLMYNGTLYGSNSVSSYMDGETLQTYENTLYNKAASIGAKLSLQNLSVSVFQSSPFYLNARLIGSAVLNSSIGTTTFPIDVVGNLSLNGTKDLLSVQNGNPIAIKSMPNYQFTTLIGNTLAVSGSRSPYMFAYAPAIFSSSGCPGTTPSFKYILFTETWSSSTCTNMVGLVTDSASSPPLVPYLIYSGTGIFTNIPSGAYVLLNGAGLSVLGLDGIQKGIKQGYYFGSNSSPSYLQTSELSAVRGSGNGLFSFNLLNRQVPNFNGESTEYIQVPAIKNIAGRSALTMSAWIYLSSLANDQIIISEDSASPSEVFQMFVNTNGQLEADFGDGSWINTATTPTGSIGLDRWYYVTATWSSGNGENIYINGIQQPISYTIGSSASTGTLGTTQAGDIANNQNGEYFDGFLSNIEIYNTSLLPAQISLAYINGIDAPPLSNSSLVAWYPLNGNANDYSGYNNNGTPENVIYTAMPGFTEDPIFKTLLNRYHSSVVKGVLNCGSLDQCSNVSIPHLYLGSRSLSVDNGNVLNETSALGLVNGSVPNAAYFNGGFIETPANQIYSESSSAFSIGFWVRPTSSGSHSTVVSNGNNWAFQYSGTTLDFGPCGVGSSCASAAATLQTNNWYFITGVFSNSPDSFQLYVNGTAASPVTGNSIGTSASSISIGNSFSGEISDLQIYNSILSSAQVQQLYQNNSVSGKQPIGYWPLSQYIYGTLNQTADTAIGNNGIIYNSNGQVCSDSNVISGECGVAINPV